MKNVNCHLTFRLLISFFTLMFAFSVITPIVSCAEAQLKAKGGYRMMLGDSVEVIALSDGVGKRPVAQQAQLLYGDKEKINETLASAYPDGQLESTVNAFLIKTGSKLVLVDAGNGKSANPAMGKVVENLRAAGFGPEKIDAIYLTHMHGDHIGGLVSGTERVFPNATVYASQREADYWLSESNLNAAPADGKRTFLAAKAALTPYKNAGKFIAFEENAELTPGITAKALYGHTPGHTAYVINDNGVVLVLWGDIVHVAAVQFADPAVTISYDSDKAEAAKARQLILAEAAKNGWLIGGAHLSMPAIGRVQANDDGGFTFESVGTRLLARHVFLCRK